LAAAAGLAVGLAAAVGLTAAVALMGDTFARIVALLLSS